MVPLWKNPELLKMKDVKTLQNHSQDPKLCPFQLLPQIIKAISVGFPIVPYNCRQDIRNWNLMHPLWKEKQLYTKTSPFSSIGIKKSHAVYSPQTFLLQGRWYISCSISSCRQVIQGCKMQMEGDWNVMKRVYTDQLQHFFFEWPASFPTGYKFLVENK